MAAKNDVTGDALVTKNSNNSYRSGWDRIFGNKPEPVRSVVQPDNAVSKAIKPPHRDATKKPYDVEVFLAGTIDMGNSEDWQQKVSLELSELDVVTKIFNPRRDDWDSSWKQEKENHQFNEQVTWELDHIERSGVIYFFFGRDSKSPITLLELGNVLGRLETYTFLDAERKPKVVVCCEEGFYRKGNVDIICDRHKVKVYDNFNESLEALKSACYIKHLSLCSSYGYVPLHTPFESQAIKLRNDKYGRLNKLSEIGSRDD